MPLTAKGKKILAKMRETYGSAEKAKQVFYSMIAEKKLTGVEKSGAKKKKKKAKK